MHYSITLILCCSRGGDRWKGTTHIQWEWGTYLWSQEGARVCPPCPKGTFSDCTVKVKFRVASQSTPEFIFPEGSKLVSGVYHVTASRERSKPVTLEIQHCSTIKGDSQHTQLEVAIADSTTGPPYHFKPYKGEYVRVFDSYVEVKLAHFSFLGSFSRASIRYCGLVCCLKSSELTHAWEYHIVLIRNLQLCIAVSELFPCHTHTPLHL